MGPSVFRVGSILEVSLRGECLGSNSGSTVCQNVDVLPLSLNVLIYKMGMITGEDTS